MASPLILILQLKYYDLPIHLCCHYVTLMARLFELVGHNLGLMTVLNRVIDCCIELY